MRHQPAIILVLQMAIVLAAGAAEPTAPASGPMPVYHGMAIQVQQAYNAEEEYGRLIREVAGLGADTVLLSANGFQKDIDSLTISAKGDCCPTDEQWLRIFEIAHREGLTIILMPKILLSDPRAGAWRGKIAPPSWKAWFSQYQQFVLRFAKLAQRGRVEVFIVGSELVTTEKHTANWREIIANVRKEFDGRLAYSANWDHYKGIQFWDDLDIIGLTTYYNVNPSREEEPSVDTLANAWAQIRSDILDWQATVKKPLLFTEVGWCSQEECSIVPWNYYHKNEATQKGLSEQQNNYEAFIKSWAGRAEVGGIIWWEWTSAPGGKDDFHYTPRNKPAEQTLRKFFKESSQQSDRESQVD